jgi:hypothetical protein
MTTREGHLVEPQPALAGRSHHGHGVWHLCSSEDYRSTGKIRYSLYINVYVRKGNPYVYSIARLGVASPREIHISCFRLRCREDMH